MAPSSSTASSSSPPSPPPYSEVVSQLPLTLRLQLSIVMNKRLFEKMPLFKDLAHNEP